MPGAQYSGNGPERLVSAAAVTADGNGAATFRLGPAPLGFVWQGSVIVTNAPTGALMTASVASTPWGQWAGPTNFGPVQLWGNETLVVNAVGLQRNVQYALQFFGVAMPAEMADPLPPVAPLSTVGVETSTLLRGPVVFDPGSPSVQVRPPTLTRRLTILIDGTNLNDTVEVDVIGNTTSITYAAYLIKPNANNPPLFVAIEPSADATYDILTVGADPGGTFTMWILASSTNPLIAGNPLGLPIPIVGAPFDTPFPQPVIAMAPWEPFASSARGTSGVASNVTVIAAPGAGRCIYVQNIGIDSTGLAAAALAAGLFHSAGGGIFCSLALVGGQVHSNYESFDGGFQLPANTALQVDVLNNAIAWHVTYSIFDSL